MANPFASNYRLGEQARAGRMLGVTKAVLPNWGKPLAFWSVITISLFLVPFTWTGFSKLTMNLGGDDSHLVFAYPIKWISHFSIPLVDQNLGGFNARLFFLPLAAVLAVVRYMQINPEAFFLGFVLASAFLATAFLTADLIGMVGWNVRFSAALAGMVVVSAPLLSATEWTHLLPTIIWLPLMPALMLFLMRHQQSAHWKWAFAAGTALLFGAPAFNSFAWTIACGLALIALIFLTIAAKRIRLQFKRLLIFVTFLIAPNLFWLVPTATNFFHSQAQVQAALVAPESKEDAVRAVKAIAPFMRLGDSLALQMSRPLMGTFNWAQLEIDQERGALRLLGYLPLLIIAGAVAKSGFRPDPSWLLRTGLVVILALFIYFVTVNVTPFGINGFVFLLRHVPGWVAERNFFDKFSIPAVMMFALATGMSFHFLLYSAKETINGVASIVVCLSLVIFNLGFFRGDYFRLPFLGGSTVNRVMDGLPKDYLAMIDRLQSLPAGNVVTLPLSDPAWSVVPSDSGKAAYIGISPIYIITGRSEYNGLGAFHSPAAPYLEAEARRSVEDGDVDAFGQLLGAIGVRYLLFGVDRALESEFARVRAPNAPLYSHPEAIRKVAPRLLFHTGRFELRELNPTLQRPLLGLQQDERLNEFGVRALEPGRSMGSLAPCGDVSKMKRLSATNYRLDIESWPRHCILVLREAFDGGWVAEIPRRERPSIIMSMKVLGFANGFRLPNDAEPPFSVEVKYKPQGAATRGAFVLALIGVLFLALATTWSRMNLKKS